MPARYLPEIGAVLVLACSWTAIAFYPEHRPVQYTAGTHSSGAWATVRSVVQGVTHGQLSGSFSGRFNDLDAQLLVPGDIILLHNAGGAYGYWTHAALYVGGDKIVESHSFERGTHISPLLPLHAYDAYEILRPMAPMSTIQAAVHAALKEVGKPYDFLASVSDERSEYCSKLVWRAYDAAGFDLCPMKAWLVPDDLSHSSLLRRVDAD